MLCAFGASLHLLLRRLSDTSRQMTIGRTKIPRHLVSACFLARSISSSHLTERRPQNMNWSCAFLMGSGLLRGAFM
ncbi:unnamed protein product [Protopolystoma xenopodis]|uniref:Uncharacterized protein n=1 Tax=Protopolystoma xenopodis TaxID=117903 RepID=A0A448WKT7_9PLAT|nr:unnamed protein product [Protopolystoma xenopodis]